MKRVAGHRGFEALQQRPPALEPLRAGLQAVRRRGDHEMVHLVESLVTGGIVSQYDLYVERAELDPRCQWCHTALGTTHHRLFCCDATCTLARDKGLAQVRAAGRAAPPGDLGMLRGLVDLKLDEAAPPSRTESCLRAGVGLRQLWSGIVCVDGSVTCPRSSRLARSGWSAVSVTADGRILGGMYGCVPGEFQEIGYAELYAVVRVLREKGLGHLTIVSDCKGIVDDYLRGEAFCTSHQSKYADLWCEFWFLVNDAGHDQVSLVWVKAHASWRVAELLGTSWCQHIGNKEADRLAKLGARLHPQTGLPECEARFAAAHEAAEQLLLHHGFVLKHLAGRDWPDRGRLPGRRGALQGIQLELERTHNGHTLERLGRAWGCLKCGIRRATRANVVSLPCVGVPRPAALAHGSHRLWVVRCRRGLLGSPSSSGGGQTDGGLEAIVFCNRCGAYARRQTHLLRTECTPPNRLARKALDKLRAGREPQTNEYWGLPFPLIRRERFDLD